MKLIDKDAVVTEIEKWLHQEPFLKKDYHDAYAFGLESVLKFLNTLEVKEVQKEPVNEKKCMFTKDNYTDKDRKVLCEDCKEECEYNKKEESVSEDLEKAANEWNAKASFTPFYMALDDNGNPNGVRRDYTTHAESFKAGAEWQKAHNWKPADGDDLPEIDREVIALLDNGKVVFAHRPPEYWDGKDIVTGKVTRNYPKTYDKGGWNIPNVKWWLDCPMQKEIEL